MLTFPMLRWVAKVGANRSKLASFSIAKYGAQADADWSYFPDAGNGILTSGTNVTNNDPNDANVANSTSLQQQWAQHLVQRWGNASAGGLRYYILDNEHSIWHQTHRDVQPIGAKMDEVRDLMIALRGRAQGRRPRRADRRPRGVGLVRLQAQRLRPAGGRRERLDEPPRPAGPRRRLVRPVPARPAAPGLQPRAARACSTS